MTKTITIPISKETCHKIKRSVGWSLWLGFFGLCMYGFVYTWYDFGNMGYSGDRALLGLATTIGSVINPAVMIWYMRKSGHWIEFKCNCDEKSNVTTTTTATEHWCTHCGEITLFDSEPRCTKCGKIQN